MIGPRHRRHFSFNEGVGEAGEAIELEPTDMQTSAPNDQNEPVEQIGDTDPSDPSAPEE